MEISTGTRASDAERATVARTLTAHLQAGRIDLAEYDDRVASVYAAVTRDDLAGVLADLPRIDEQSAASPDYGTAASATRAPAWSKRVSRVPIWQRIEGSAWLGVSVLVLLIWGAISLGVGELTYFWPMWVIGPWGVVLLFRAVSGFESCATRR